MRWWGREPVVAEAVPRPKSRAKQPRLIAYLNSYTEGISGGDACFIEIAKRLSGMEIIVVTSRLGAAACRARGLECRFWTTTHEPRVGHLIATYVVRIIKGLLFTWRLERDDLIYASSDFLPDVIPAFWGKLRLRGLSWLQKSFHIIPPSRPVPHFAQRLSHVLIGVLADSVVVDNTLLKAALIDRGIAAGKLRVNYPGIDSAFYQAFPGHETRDYDASYLGRIQRSKGVFDLVEIWRYVRERRPDARLAVVGRGDAATMSSFGACIAEAGLGEHVRVLGFLDTAQAVGTLRRSKVFVFPSPEEGFGMAVLEAIACGLPVVAWDLPVYREVFPRGLLRVPIGRLEAFGAAVLALLDDRDLCARLVDEGRGLPASYDWERVASREHDLLRSLMPVARREH